MFKSWLTTKTIEHLCDLTVKVNSAKWFSKMSTIFSWDGLLSCSAVGGSMCFEVDKGHLKRCCRNACTVKP